MGIMNLSEIMDRSIDILRKHVKSIALFSIGYGIVAFIAIFIMIILGAIVSAIAAGLLKSFWAMGIFLTLIGIFATAFGLCLYAGTIKIASQEYTGEEVFAQDAIKISFKSIFKVCGIIFFGVLMFIPAAGVIWLIGKSFYSTFDRIMTNIDLYTGRQLLFVIPPLLFMLAIIFIVMAYVTWFAFTINVLVVEKKGVLGSIKRSFSLIRSNYWKVFGCILLFSLTTFALRSSLDIIMAVVSGILYFISKLLNLSEDFITFFTSIYSYASWPINLVTWMVISPINIIMITMLYFNQRFKKEGFDIALKLKEIQKNEERKQLSEVTSVNDTL